MIKEIEDKVFFNSFIVSPRNAAKAMLEAMDESMDPNYMKDMQSPLTSLKKEKQSERGSVRPMEENNAVEIYEHIIQ